MKDNSIDDLQTRRKRRAGGLNEPFEIIDGKTPGLRIENHPDVVRNGDKVLDIALTSPKPALRLAALDQMKNEELRMDFLMQAEIGDEEWMLGWGRVGVRVRSFVKEIDGERDLQILV